MKDNCRMTASLEARNLTKAYRNGGEELIVLEDVTLRIQAGETCAIIGPSGSGKSTLLGLCAGLDQQTRGEVFIEGTRITGMSEDALAQLRNQRLGFVFQSFQLLQNLTSLENVMVPLELRGDRSAQTRARALLERVGLRGAPHPLPHPAERRGTAAGRAGPGIHQSTAHHVRRRTDGKSGWSDQRHGGGPDVRDEP